MINSQILDETGEEQIDGDNQLGVFHYLQHRGLAPAGMFTHGAWNAKAMRVHVNQTVAGDSRPTVWTVLDIDTSQRILCAEPTVAWLETCGEDWTDDIGPLRWAFFYTHPQIQIPPGPDLVQMSLSEYRLISKIQIPHWRRSS